MLIGLVVACCGQVLADDKVTYSSDVHPTQIYSLKSFYDIDGDGILEVVGGTDRVGYSEQNAPIVSKTNGTLVKIINTENLANNWFYNLVMYHNTTGPYIFEENYYEQYNARNMRLWEYASFKQLPPVASYGIDLNNDGLLTYIGDINADDSTFTVWKQKKDGSFYKTKISYTSDVSQIKSSAISNCAPSGLGSNVGSLGDGMFVRSKENTMVDWDEEISEAKSSRTIAIDGENSRSFIKSADFNGDGRIDFVRGSYIFYNLGNDKFFLSPHVGTIYPADLNGDGLLDYIDFGNGNVDLYLAQPDGKLSEKKTIFSNEAMQNAFFGDFDKDGDVDILLFVPTSEATYTVFFRNDGNGVFKKKESYIEGKYKSFECKDYDADGLYEVLINKTIDDYYQEQSENDYLLKCNKDFTTTLIELPEGKHKLLADFNHDGITEINSGASYTPIANTKKNTRPEKMSKPIVKLSAEENLLEITWAEGKDAETSSCDLTYELRIGTASGKGDVLFGHALADGTRRNLLDGNIGHLRRYIFDTNSLPIGQFYIAVQAIDAGNMGGEWSDEFVYNHQQIAAPVIAHIPSAYSTVDTISLRVQNSMEDATYTWNIPHGKIISASANP